MATSFAGDIRPLFTDRDIECMADYGVKLDDYAYMSDPAGFGAHADHANARSVFERLLPEAGARRMPKHGPYWTECQIGLYRGWMDEGFAP